MHTKGRFTLSNSQLSRYVDRMTQHFQLLRQDERDQHAGWQSPHFFFFKTTAHPHVACGKVGLMMLLSCVINEGRVNFASETCPRMEELSKQVEGAQRQGRPWNRGSFRVEKSTIRLRNS